MRAFTIGSTTITDDSPAYVVAELGHNHGGDVTVARQMILTAAGCGVSAVKLQKRNNATLYSPAMLAQPYVNEHSYGPTYGAHRAALEFDSDAYLVCLAEAASQGVACFATAFDEPSAAFLVSLSAPAIKLASGALTDTALLRYVAQFDVPVILSTGGGTAQEIDAAMQILSASLRSTQIALLHCTAAYPVRDYAEFNLRCIATLRSRYPNTVIGWSSHESGISLAGMAYTLGARILEHHVTLNRANKGTDHAFSLEPAGLRKLCRDLKRAHVALGDGVKRSYPSEASALAKMRRTEVNGRWQVRTLDERLVEAL